jgi:CBS domain-containing protein
MTCRIDRLDTEAVTSLEANTNIQQATAYMAKHGLGSLLVTDSETDKVIGLFTEHDLLTRVIGAGKQPQATSLGEVCSRNLISIPHDSTCKAAIQLMRRNNCRRLLVYHHDNLRGLIGISTIAHAMTEHQGFKNMLVNLVGGLTLAVVLAVIVMLIIVLPDMLQVAEHVMR